MYSNDHIRQMSSVKWIAIFNPENGTIVSSIDYTFQPHVTSGARFGQKYQAGTFIYRLDETTAVFAPTFPLDSQVQVLFSANCRHLLDSGQLFQGNTKFY